MRNHKSQLRKRPAKYGQAHSYTSFRVSSHRLELDWCILLWREHPQSFGEMKADLGLSVSLF